MTIKRVSLISNIVLLLALLLVFNCSGNKEEEPKEKIITEYVEVPVEKIVKEFDTIYEPKPIYVEKEVIDSTYYDKYNELKSQAEKDSLFRESIKIREYTETYEDEHVKIDVYSKVRGELKEQAPKYEIKPRTVTVPQTTIIKSEPPKIHLYGGLEAGIPTQDFKDFNAKASLYLQNKKGNMTTLGADLNKTVYVGYVFRIW